MNPLFDNKKSDGNNIFDLSKKNDDNKIGFQGSLFANNNSDDKSDSNKNTLIGESKPMNSGGTNFPSLPAGKSQFLDNNRPGGLLNVEKKSEEAKSNPFSSISFNQNNNQNMGGTSTGLSLLGPQNDNKKTDSLFSNLSKPESTNIFDDKDTKKPNALEGFNKTEFGKTSNSLFVNDNKSSNQTGALFGQANNNTSSIFGNKDLNKAEQINTEKNIGFSVPGVVFGDNNSNKNTSLFANTQNKNTSNLGMNTDSNVFGTTNAFGGSTFNQNQESTLPNAQNIIGNKKNNTTIFPESKPQTNQPQGGFLGMGKVDSEQIESPNPGVFGNLGQNNASKNTNSNFIQSKNSFMNKMEEEKIRPDILQYNQFNNNNMMESEIIQDDNLDDKINECDIEVQDEERIMIKDFSEIHFRFLNEVQNLNAQLIKLKNSNQVQSSVSQKETSNTIGFIKQQKKDLMKKTFDTYTYHLEQIFNDEEFSEKNIEENLKIQLGEAVKLLQPVFKIVYIDDECPRAKYQIELLQPFLERAEGLEDKVYTQMHKQGLNDQNKEDYWDFILELMVTAQLEKLIMYLNMHPLVKDDSNLDKAIQLIGKREKYYIPLDKDYTNEALNFDIDQDQNQKKFREIVSELNNIDFRNTELYKKNEQDYQRWIEILSWFGGDIQTIADMSSINFIHRILAYLIFINPTQQRDNYREYKDLFQDQDDEAQITCDIISEIVAEPSDASNAFTYFQQFYNPYISFHIGQILFQNNKILQRPDHSYYEKAGFENFSYKIYVEYLANSKIQFSIFRKYWEKISQNEYEDSTKDYSSSFRGQLQTCQDKVISNELSNTDQATQDLSQSNFATSPEKEILQFQINKGLYESLETVLVALKDKAFRENNLSLVIDILAETGRVDPLEHFVIQFMKKNYFEQTLIFLSRNPICTNVDDRVFSQELEDLKSKQAFLKSCRSLRYLKQKCYHLNLLRSYIELRISLKDIIFVTEDSKKPENINKSDLRRTQLDKKSALAESVVSLLKNFSEKVPEFFVYFMAMIVGHSDYVDFSFAQSNELINTFNKVNILQKIKPIGFDSPFNWSNFQIITRSFLYNKLKTSKISF